MTIIDMVLFHNENNISISHSWQFSKKLRKSPNKAEDTEHQAQIPKCDIIHKINESHINQNDAEAFRSYLQPLSEREDCRKRIVEIFWCLKSLSMMVSKELFEIQPL